MKGLLLGASYLLAGCVGSTGGGSKDKAGPRTAGAEACRRTAGAAGHDRPSDHRVPGRAHGQGFAN